MSETGRENLGYPRSNVRSRKFMLERFCGGYGFGGCAEITDATQFVYAIKVPKYLVFNRSLTLNNPDDNGVDIFEDAGADEFCLS